MTLTPKEITGAGRLGVEARPSRMRRGWALALSVVSFLCAAVFLLAVAFNCWQASAGVYNGPLLALVAALFTFPVALLCTLVSVVLVGARHCKLAWLSLSSYSLPIVLAIVAAAWEHISKK
jgi:glucan phosphoethanolaminetransferase (alkaline phosphatase superfamily)